MASTTPQQRTSAYEHAASPDGANVVLARADWRDPRYQAFALMRLAFTVAPIAFGLDKFFNVMVDWPKYLAPWINDIAPGTGQQFMYFVGATEILAGLIVALKPRYGAYVVAGWLAGIVINLLTYSGVLRHRLTRLRAHARRPHPRAPRLRLRRPAATPPALSDRCPPPPARSLMSTPVKRAAPSSSAR